MVLWCYSFSALRHVMYHSPSFMSQRPDISFPSFFICAFCYVDNGRGHTVKGQTSWKHSVWCFSSSLYRVQTGGAFMLIHEVLCDVSCAICLYLCNSDLIRVSPLSVSVHLLCGRGATEKGGNSDLLILIKGTNRWCCDVDSWRSLRRVTRRLPSFMSWWADRSFLSLSVRLLRGDAYVQISLCE